LPSLTRSPVIGRKAIVTTSPTHHTVINRRREKAVWPNRLDLPAGWRPVGAPDTEEGCLAALRALPTPGRCAEALRRHPLVHSAWVHPLRRDTGLVVVPDLTGRFTAADQGMVLDAWQLIFDEMYADEPDDELVGWVDSTTGEPVSSKDMADWVRATVERITPLRRARVLEIGSGTGMIARSVLALGGIERYVATDVSQSAVQNLRRALGDCAVVEYHVGDAQSVAAGLDGDFDLLILNSVCQYFPSTRYLTDLLTQVAQHVAIGGHILLGDLRHAGLEPRLAEERARLYHQDGAVDLEARAQELLAKVSELALLPSWCERLERRVPGVTAVDTGPRLGTAATEMACFRFDALLHVGCPPAPAPTAPAQDATALDGADVRERRTDGPFRYVGVPNARLADEPDAVDPGTLRGGPGALTVRFADDGGDGALDVAWSPEALARRCGWSHPPLHASDMIAPALPPRVSRQLVDALAEVLREEFGTLDPALEILLTDETVTEWRS